jgi:hypothetical protein
MWKSSRKPASERATMNKEIENPKLKNIDEMPKTKMVLRIEKMPILSIILFNAFFMVSKNSVIVTYP